MADSSGFDRLLGEYGEPRGGARMSLEEAVSYRDRVPKALIDFWVAHGHGGYRDGWMWLTDPAPFDPLLARIFDGDPEYRAEDMTTILRGAYAEIVVWDRALNGVSFICLNQNVIDPARINDGWFDEQMQRRHSNDHVISHIVFRMIHHPLDESDDHGMNLSEASIDHFGSLAENEIFGFVPVLQMGGAALIENVRKVDMITHLNFLVDVADMHFRKTLLPGRDLPPDSSFRMETGRRVGRVR